MRREVFDRLPKSAVKDVDEFLEENGDPKKLDRTVGQLEPREFLKWWLEWNGLFRYDEEILQLVEALGWKLAEESSATSPKSADDFVVG